MNHLRFNTMAAIVILTVSSMATSCRDNVTPPNGKALFESFSYKGDDDVYRTHQLPDGNSFYNPILPGWYSDPTICTNGQGDYFLATSTFTFVPGVPLFHSRDLVNWTKIGHVLTRDSQMKNFRHQHVSGGIFAPDIKYNPANKTYYMITTNVGAGNFFVKTTDPWGEWSEPVYLPEIQGIDPSFFFDNDGRAYIVNNDDAPDASPEYPGHRTVRIMEFDTVQEKCIGRREILVDKGWRPQDRPIWCEGPHIYNIDGTYYLMTAEGGTSTGHSEVIYRGVSPMGPFEPWEGNPILTQRDLDPARPEPVTCAGHADMVQTPEGDWWAVFLACRPIDGEFENLGRETFLMPVKWTDDGWPYITRPGETIPMTVSRPGVIRGKDVTFGNFEWTDRFDTACLDKEWHTLRGYADDLYSLDEHPGYLTLQCSDIPTTAKDVPAFIGRRVQHHRYECTTHMIFEPSDTLQHAGLVIFKDETHQYQLSRRHAGDCDRIVLHMVADNGTTELASADLCDGAQGIDLRIISHGRTYDFLFSTDGGRNWISLITSVDARHTSTATAGGFTGTLIGPYASAV